MTEAIKESIDTINCRNAMMIEALQRWCPDTNEFFTWYGEVGITLWEFVAVSMLPTIRDLFEYIPSNQEITTLPEVTQSLFHIFAMFNMDKVPYRLWVDSAQKRQGEMGFEISLPCRYVCHISEQLCLPLQSRREMCPSTFITTSKLALGRRVNLALASLCCLYSGLREILNHRISWIKPFIFRCSTSLDGCVCILSLSTT